nr:MAG TPA: hypothetical protein [Caudoviricetes sp.]
MLPPNVVKVPLTIKSFVDILPLDKLIKFAVSSLFIDKELLTSAVLSFVLFLTDKPLTSAVSVVKLVAVKVSTERPPEMD